MSEINPITNEENDRDLQEWTLMIERISNNVDGNIRIHLSKFLNGGLELLLNRWIDYYFVNQNIIELTLEQDKDKYREYLKKQILLYISFFSKTRDEKKILKESIKTITDKYHKLLYDGETDPIEEVERSERLENAKLKTPATTTGVVIEIARGLYGALSGRK